MTHGPQVCIAPAIAFEKIVLPLFATDDELKVRPRPQVAAYLEQHDVVEFVFLVAARLPEVLQLARVIGIDKETATARGLGIFLYVELGSEHQQQQTQTTKKTQQKNTNNPTHQHGQGG